jgi:hypothetical protein
VPRIGCAGEDQRRVALSNTDKSVALLELDVSPETFVNTDTIYVALLNEGTDVWRPVQAEKHADSLYVIVSKNDGSEDQKWQFPSESIVRCESRQLSGKTCLVAVSTAT